MQGKRFNKEKKDRIIRFMREHEEMSIVEIADTFGISAQTAYTWRKKEGIINLYKVTLCWYGENHIFHRVAAIRSTAITLARRAFEKKMGLESGSTIAYFKKSGMVKAVKVEGNCKKED